MNILVTGGLGFIGSNFIKYIFDKYEDYHIHNVDLKTYAANYNNIHESIIGSGRYTLSICDINDTKRLKNLIMRQEINCIINFAAESHVDNSINNSLANTTKIVYINSKKIPKPLVQSTWRPESVICCDGSKNYTKVDTFLYESDLVFNINGQTSMFLNFYDTAETI